VISKRGSGGSEAAGAPFTAGQDDPHHGVHSRMSMTAAQRWQARSARLFVRTCQASTLCVAAWVLDAIVGLFTPKGLLEPLMAGDAVWAQVLSALVLLIVVGLPLLVPMVAMAFLALSMWVGREPSPQEMRWSWLAWLMCALGLLMLLWSQVCSPPIEDAKACGLNAALFVVDQFNHGAFGDVFDVFGFSLSSLDMGALGGWARFQILTLRMLCALCVLSLLVLWLGRPLARLAQSAPVHAAHRLAHRAFRAAGHASLLCLVIWTVALSLDMMLFPGMLDRLADATVAPAVVLRAVLTVLMGAIPVVVPVISFVHLGLAMLVGHHLRGRDIAWATCVLLLCAAALWPLLEDAACQGTDEAKAACSDQGLGFVADQFYKGAFADVFDVYELKLGEVDGDNLGVAEKLLILNFRFLCAAYVVALLLAFSRYRAARKERRGARSRRGRAAARPAEMLAAAPTDEDWPKTVFAETQPMSR
jgi:hypothetical protein